LQVRKKHFNVLLTTYELLMSDADRARLVKIKWAGIVVDEGHRWVWWKLASQTFDKLSQSTQCM
jgi:SNF2 family DNA or RNA helicase